MSKFKTILRNIGELVCVSNSRELYKAGESLKDLAILKNAAVVVDTEGLIHEIGDNKAIEEKYSSIKFEFDIDCQGKSVIPGFVDAHTHSICPGDRVHEFEMKLKGATYMDIQKAGGGIGFTTNCVRQSSEEELLKCLLGVLRKIVKFGTTTLEVKSGFGLDTENELKMLRVIKQARQFTKLDLVANYCGAHSFPKGMNEEQATQDVLQNQIPALKKALENKEVDAEFIDVFCEKGVYEKESTRKILEAGKNIGLMINFHGDEIEFVDSGRLGAEVGARAISHCENLDDAGIDAMIEKKIAAVILPSTQFLLKLKIPPVRKLIERGGIFALGSDYCPNAACMSMPLVMNMACINMKALPHEVLAAATLNSAYAINRSQTHGSIEVGKVADFVILDVDNYKHISYQFGQTPISKVLKRGEPLYEDL